MSIPPERIEEVTRVVLRVMEEYRRPDAPARPWWRLWNWFAEHATAGLAVLAAIFLAFALIYNHVGPRAVADKVTGDYQEAQDRRDLIEQHVELGERFLGSEQETAATAEFEKALEIDSTNVDAQRGLSRATLFAPISQGDYDPAVTIIRLLSLLDEDSGDAHAHAFLGDVYREEFRYELALREYEAALNADPELPHAWAGRGLVYSFQGKSQLAVKNFRAAQDLDRPSQAYKQYLASELLWLGRYDETKTAEAKRLLEQIIAEDPDFILAWLVAAKAYRATNDLITARDYLEDVIFVSFADPEIRSLDRNADDWYFRTNLKGEFDYLRSNREKLAYSLLQLALTAYLQGDRGVATRTARRARGMDLFDFEAASVREMLLLDMTILARTNTGYAPTVRLFRRRLLGDFGRL
jgi:Tfp pilus assembly protein PilF